MNTHSAIEACPPNEIEVDISLAAIPSVLVGDTVMLNNGSFWIVDAVTDPREISLRNDKGKPRGIQRTPKGNYQGGNQLRIQRIIRTTGTYAAITTPTVQQETCETLTSLTNDQLADIVIEGFKKIRAFLPHIRMLKERFRSGDRDSANRLKTPIKGCLSWKEFCKKHLDRTTEALREALKPVAIPPVSAPPKQDDSLLQDELNKLFPPWRPARVSGKSGDMSLRVKGVISHDIGLIAGLMQATQSGVGFYTSGASELISDFLEIVRHYEGFYAYPARLNELRSLLQDFPKPTEEGAIAKAVSDAAALAEADKKIQF